MTHNHMLTEPCAQCGDPVDVVDSVAYRWTESEDAARAFRDAGTACHYGACTETATVALTTTQFAALAATFFCDAHNREMMG